ncbi:hypothetical protein [Helicobacter labacensis]|uniref:hypothetical protein n=1 Tax=Helicobacter labacensis TaxID=2316079 RepID=UPI000EB0468A|nr:hypothetical protein [Helicobacter labacensis]
MKLAKFALTCDGEKITSLEQLKEHFNLLDVLEHYKTNTLWRWLRSRGYQNELAGIEAITATQDTEILKALCEVFGIEADLQMIQETPKNHQRMRENEALKAELKACREQLRTLQATPPAPQHAPDPRDYLKSYNTLRDKLFNAQDLESGKAILKELLEDYSDLLRMERVDVLSRCLIHSYESKSKFFAALFLYMCHYLLKKYEFFTQRAFGVLDFSVYSSYDESQRMKDLFSMGIYVGKMGRYDKSYEDYFVKPNMVVCVVSNSDNEQL